MRELELEGIIFEVGSGDPEVAALHPQIKIGIPVSSDEDDDEEDVEYRSIIVNTDEDTAKIFAPYLFDKVKISISLIKQDVVHH